jgi:hypothetical protein
MRYCEWNLATRGAGDLPFLCHWSRRCGCALKGLLNYPAGRAFSIVKMGQTEPR